MEARKTKSKRLRFAVFGVLVLLLAYGVSASWCQDAPTQTEPIQEVQNQEGLPPELVIAEDVPLSQQLITHRALADAAKEYNPRPGILSGCTEMFSGGSKPQGVSVTNLKLHADELVSQLVRVEGMYVVTGDDAVIRSVDDEVKIVLAGGVAPEGFDVAGGTADGLPVLVQGLVETEDGAPLVRAQLMAPSEGLLRLRIGRILEMQSDYEGAVKAYDAVAKDQGLARGPLGPFARIRAGELAFDELRDQKLASKHYSAAWQPYTVSDREGNTLYHTWQPTDGGSWVKVTVRDAIASRLQQLNSKRTAYQIVDFFVRLAGGSKPWGIILMAVLVRLCIYPLTKKQLESSRRMQAIQPQTKALQKKYADDKQKFQEEFWKLCQENKCNPLGGCLPLLVQMPILIFLYRGIRDYIVEFDGTSFLWISNLSQPDIFLLIAYTVSMIFFQKMSSMNQPAMDPQQQQQQKMMAYMMPVMFFFLFQSFPAAFILYWLGANVIYLGEQWFFLRKKPGSDDGGVVVEAASAPADKPKKGFASSMLKAMGSGKDEEEAPVSFHDKQQTKKGSKRGKRK